MTHQFIIGVKYVFSMIFVPLVRKYGSKYVRWIIGIDYVSKKIEFYESVECTITSFQLLKPLKEPADMFYRLFDGSLVPCTRQQGARRILMNDKKDGGMNRSCIMQKELGHRFVAFMWSASRRWSVIEEAAPHMWEQYWRFRLTSKT